MKKLTYHYDVIVVGAGHAGTEAAAAARRFPTGTQNFSQRFKNSLDRVNLKTGCDHNDNELMAASGKLAEILRIIGSGTVVASSSDVDCILHSDE